MQIGRNGLSLSSGSNYSSKMSKIAVYKADTARISGSSISSSSSNKSIIAARIAGSSDSSVYTGIKTSSASVKTHATKLASTDEDSIFATATEDEDTSTIVTEIKTVVRDYNSMISNMETTGSTVNNYFLKELNSYSSENQEGLEAVGITIEDDGSLTIDEKTLENAEIEDLKEVFNGSESFAAKIAAKCSSIQAKAISDINIKAYASST